MAKSIDELLQMLPRFVPGTPELYAGVYRPQSSQVSVSTSGGVLLAANPRRVSYALCNYGTGRAFIGFSPGVLTTTGFPVMENGGVLNTSILDDRNLPTQPVWVIGSAATTVAIVELIRES